jgi:hypothetical protein
MDPERNKIVKLKVLCDNHLLVLKPCPLEFCRYNLGVRSKYAESNCTLQVAEDNPKGLGFGEIADRLGVTRQMCIKIFVRALKKFKKSREFNKVKELYIERDA